tara:strand:+ start:607 stop:1530 length:924 start_codon:yes stop_codon:yes gene_type:complete
MDIDTLEGFIRLISDSDIFQGDDFLYLLRNISMYPEDKSVPLLTKILPYIDFEDKIYKVVDDGGVHKNFYYEKTFDTFMGSWEHFTAFDYKASLLYKLYNQRDSLKLFKLLLDSGFKFPLNRIDMIIHDSRKKHKYEFIKLLLELGYNPYNLSEAGEYDINIHDLLNEYKQTIKNKQILSLAKTQDMLRDITGNDLDPSIFVNITKHLRNKNIDPHFNYEGYVLERRQTKADNYDVDGYDAKGYDIEGYDANGYDKDGYDVDGYDANGYDIEGYDIEGYDIEGYDIDGNKKHKGSGRSKKLSKKKKR